jgi:hypothetical protein
MSKICAPVLLLYFVFFFASSAVLTPQSLAQSQASALPAPVAPHMYDSTKEVVLTGTISEVVARPKSGLPLGAYLMLSTAQGQMDVHLGPYAGRIAGQKGLIPGATIQVTGVTAHFAGGDVFLARTIAAGNQTLTIRNQNGIPVHQVPAGTGAMRGTSSSGGR